MYSDVPSQAYKNTDTSLFAIIRPGLIIMSDETELVVVEVKPFNASPSLKEADAIRVAEHTKKILHWRMVRSKTTKEFCSFGTTASGKYVFFSNY